MTYERDIRESAAMNSSGTNNPGVNPRAEQILPGAPVFDAAGEQIGTVSDAGFTDGMLSIHRHGIQSIFTRDTTVPLSAIARTDASGVYLTLTKDQMRGGTGSGSSGGRATPGVEHATAPEPGSSRPEGGARPRPTDMATDSGSPQADLDVPPPDER